MDEVRYTTEIKPSEPQNDDLSEDNSKVEELTVEKQIELKCEEYDIPSDIPLAIARLETGHFTSRAYKEGNNVGGMSVDEVPLEYDSLYEGVDAFVSNLAENYFGQGLTTVDEIGKKYCPVNENWADIVKELMQ